MSKKDNIKLILGLIQIKKAFDKKIIDLSEIKKIISILDFKGKTNLNFENNEYIFLQNLLSLFGIEEFIYYYSFFKDLNVIENLDLNILIPFVKADKINEFLVIKNNIELKIEMIKENENEHEFSLDDDKISLTYNRFANFDSLLDYGQTTLLLAPRTGGGKTTTILNIMLDAIENNDVFILYFGTREVTKEEFWLKLGSIVFAENLMEKYKTMKRLKSIIKRNNIFKITKIKDELKELEKNLKESNRNTVIELLNKIINNIKNNIKKIINYHLSKKEEINSLNNLINVLQEDIDKINKKINVVDDEYIKRKLIEVKQQKELTIENYKKQIEKISQEFKRIAEFVESIKGIESEIKELKVDFDNINNIKEIIKNVINLFEEFNKKYNNFIFKKEQELLELENDLKEKKAQIIKMLGDKIYLETKEEIKIENVQDTIEKFKHKNLLVIIDYLQMMTSEKKFNNEMAMFQYISSRILTLSKLPNTNIGFIIASQAASKREAKILTEDDVKGFKNVINTMANAIAVYNMEQFIPENEKEEGRRSNKKPLSIINVIKARDGVKSYNKYYVFNNYTNKLEPLDWEEEKILFKENIFSRGKVDIKIAYYDDLLSFKWEDQDINEDDEIPDIGNNKNIISRKNNNLYKKQENILEPQKEYKVAPTGNSDNKTDLEKVLEDVI